MKKILLFVFFAFVHSVYGQVVLENNPTSLKWYEVNTPHFRVLFPEGFDDQAQRMAQTLEHIHEPEARTMGASPRKISVVLQNQSSVSNGFVSLLPRRSEFYTMPPQDYNFAGTNDWLNLLASHEYRHIVQYQHATRGFNRLFYYLFGNPTLAGMAQVAAPQWFWEGDAVATETAFTPSGRGKIPNFGLLFRTNMLEGRSFNYHKQYLRSYKHNIPNHYVLGYYMISYLRRKTNDAEVWEKVSKRSWTVPFIPFAFSNSVKHHTNRYITGLYRDMAAELTQEWQNEVNRLRLTAFERVPVSRGKAYTDYMYPQPQADGSVLVMKRGIGDIEQFVLLRNGKEESVFTPGFMNDAGMLTTAHDQVVWNEFGYDPRWQVRNYSRIKGYDRTRKQRWVIADKRTRYGAAALSPDGTRVATVRSDNAYHHALVILSVPDGRVLREYPNPNNDFYAMPRWDDTGSKLVVLKNNKAGKTIRILSVEGDEAEDVLPVSQENVGAPVLRGQYVFFNSPVSGIDNLYVFDLKGRQRYQVTTSKHGAYNASISLDGKYIYYNEQGRDGMDVVRVPFNPADWSVPQPVDPGKPLYQHLVEQEGRPGLLDSIPQEKLPVRRYAKIRGIINPFSWGAFVDNSLTQVDFGITSRDILSTTNITAGYTFDLNERTGYWRAGLSYQGLYPILDVNFTKGSRSVDEDRLGTLIIRGQDSTLVVNDIKFKWDEENIEMGLRLPLITTSSKYAGSVTIGNAVGITRVTNFRNTLVRERYVPAIIRNDTVLSVYPFFDYIGNGTLLYNRFTLSAYRLLKTSRRDIYSRWGQAVNVNYYSTPYGGDLGGGLISATAYLYLPGLFKHHSLWGYGAYQQTLVETNFREALNDYMFRNTVPLPRGVDVNRFQRFYSMSVNYTLPLWYPDIALGPLLNIQRVRLNGFLDHAVGDFRFFNGTNANYTSVGGELRFDINVMRFLPQMNLGLRYSYGLQPSVTKFEFLLGTFNF